MPAFVDQAQVQLIVEAVARLGVGENYCVIVEPVRGWYYVHLCHRGNHETDRGQVLRVKSQLRGDIVNVLAQSIWTAEDEIGPVDGATLRRFILRCVEQDKRGLELPEIRVVADRVNGVKVRRTGAAFSRTEQVRTGTRVQSWKLTPVSDVRGWPDEDDLA